MGLPADQIREMFSGDPKMRTQICDLLSFLTSMSPDVLAVLGAADAAAIITALGISEAVPLTGDLTGNVTGDVTGNVTGDVTGNADTATKLETARAINGVDFDGSAPITIPGVISIAKQTIGHADLDEDANGVAQDFELTDVPANAVLLGAIIKTKTAFSGGSIATLGIDVTVDEEAIIEDYDGLAAGGAANFDRNGDAVTLFVPAFAARAAVVTFTPDAEHNLDDLTAGAVDVWLVYLPGVTPS